MQHHDHPLLERVVIVGTSGSGKTTLAHDLASALDHSHIELDALAWAPNWVVRDDETIRAALEERTRARGWVLDGNYNRFRDITWSRADTIVWLNYSFGLTMRRIVTRTMRRALFKEDLWGTNREELSKAFSRDSIILWSAKTWTRNRRRYYNVGPETRDKVFVELNHPRETDGLLRLARAIGARRRHDGERAS